MVFCWNIPFLMYAHGYRILSSWIGISCLVRPILVRHRISSSLARHNPSQNIPVLHGSPTSFPSDMIQRRIICCQILGSNSRHGWSWLWNSWYPSQFYTVVFYIKHVIRFVSATKWRNCQFHKFLCR